jgi:uncharacterized membrane protein YphA (DoxX/SURF4 family)
MENAKLNQAWWTLRVTFGLIPVVAGLDKFFNLLTDWQQYLSPLALKILPMSGSSAMKVVGVVEVAVGLMILTRWTRLGAYVASAWLVLIALNLLTMGRYLDIAARDVALAVAAFALARLDEVRAGVPAEGRRFAPAAPLAAQPHQ